MTEGLRALPTTRAICSAVALCVRLSPTGAAIMMVEQSCRKSRRDTPLFRRCVPIVSFPPVDIDSLLATWLWANFESSCNASPECRAQELLTRTEPDLED